MYSFHFILLQGKCTDTNGSIFSKYEEPCFQFEIPEDIENSSEESLRQSIASEKPISNSKHGSSYLEKIEPFVSLHLPYNNIK